MSSIKQSSPLDNLSTSTAILIGSVIISVSILISGGTISLKGVKTPTTPTAPTAVAPADVKPAAKEVTLEPVTDTDHLRGDKNSRIILVEYSDLECPFCKSFHPTLEQVAKEYAGKVAWVYRHFPLDSLHSQARKEAEATECAAELGGNDAFWKLTDKIYEVTPGNNGLDMAQLPTYAAQIGLDETKFKSCLDGGGKAATVEKDVQSGIKSGVQGTPAAFLYDTKTKKTVTVPGAVPFEELKNQIDTILKS